MSHAPQEKGFRAPERPRGRVAVTVTGDPGTGGLMKAIGGHSPFELVLDLAAKGEHFGSPPSDVCTCCCLLRFLAVFFLLCPPRGEDPLAFFWGKVPRVLSGRVRPSGDQDPVRARRGQESGLTQTGCPGEKARALRREEVVTQRSHGRRE